MTAIVALPFLLGIFAILLKDEIHRTFRRKLLIVGAILHNAGVISILISPNFLQWGEYIKVDGLGVVFLCLISVIFTIVSFYSLGYFPLKSSVGFEEAGGHIYVSCMFFFLAAMTLAVSTTHIGILWIAIEGTTLASAPLIYYRQSKRSLEAAWKYLLICSVGIAIALLGVFFVAASAKGTGADLFVPSLIARASSLNHDLLRIGFILIMIGFGTKVGLAPLHNWLPDAHSESPAPISALLSGTLLNCALLGIIRFYQICVASGLGDFAGRLLMFFGIVSLLFATVFIAYQKDYKRLLAYSSVEHMGIIVLGLGVGATYASILHVVGHSLTKTLLFLISGNIYILYKTKMASEVTGLVKTSPPTGFLFLIGGFAILGAPPFLPFISEFLILRHGCLSGHFIAMAIYLLSLGIIFVTMSRAVLKMSQGKKRELVYGDLPKMLLVPPAVLAVAVAMTGIYLPKSFSLVIENAVRLIKL